MRKFTYLLILALCFTLLACQEQINEFDDSTFEAKTTLQQELPDDAPDFVKELAAHLIRYYDEVVEDRQNDLSIYRYLTFKPDLSIFRAAVDRIPGLKMLLDNYLLPATALVPNNAAFEKFFQETGFQTIDEVPFPLLSRVISNHILLGRKDIEWLDEYMRTLAYADCNVRGRLNIFVDVVDPNNAIINGYATVLNGNLFVGRGFVHVIDMVIAPTRMSELITNNPEYSILTAALNCDGLQTNFQALLFDDPGPFTLFAPTNAAFEALFEMLNISSVCEIDPAMLETILRFHIKPNANITFSMMARNKHLHTLADNLGYETELTDNNQVRLVTATNSALIVQADLQANNGIIHGIDAVLMP